MQIIPLQPVPAQTLSVLLAGQQCKISVYQKTTGLYIDLSMGGALVVSAVLCRDRQRIVRQAYHGFAGELSFADTQGKSDPDYTGLGGRFLLTYIEAAALP